jgi:hypothetical protein
MAIDQPGYHVGKSYPDFELRDYPPFLVAETEVEGSRAEAGNQGFRRLAGYIFGGNKGARRIPMTAPVGEVAATRIAMTAPVGQMASGVPGSFLIQFTMPAEFALDTLPEPLDDRIRFRQVPARRVAAIRYSGTWSEGRYRTHLERLRAALAREGLEAVGEPVWARYDPPFKPWFLRRNEVLVEVRPDGVPESAVVPPPG